MKLYQGKVQYYTAFKCWLDRLKANLKSLVHVQSSLMALILKRHFFIFTEGGCMDIIWKREP